MGTKIHFPKINKPNYTIAVTAPSSGLGGPEYISRFNTIVDQLQSEGHLVILGDCLKLNHKHVSASRQERAHEFMRFWNDPEIDLIFPPWGGEILIDILPLIDFSKLGDNPTWVQGFSDIATLLLAITVKTGIATAHGTNMIDSIKGQDLLTASSRDYLTLTKGQEWIQKSSDYWQKTWPSYQENPLALYQLSEPTKWLLLGHQTQTLKVAGRLIGGCLDTIGHLVGTEYGDIKSFASRYSKSEGLLLYLENSDSNPTEVYRILWNLRLAGWFDQANAVIFGRNNGPDSKSDEDLSYQEALIQSLQDLGIPIILDADIGHVVPQMTLINGALAQLEINSGKAILSQLIG